MKKIPTLFERDENFHVIDKVRPGCEWVLDGEGVATEKLDGTNVRLTIRSGRCVRLEKRRNPSKVQKLHGVTVGWYADAVADGLNDKWLFEAMANTPLNRLGMDQIDVPDGEYSAEAVGPRIQGNPLSLKEHTCVFFTLDYEPHYSFERSFSWMERNIPKLESRWTPGRLAEGVVFHHPDGRMAKIKGKDFEKETK